MYFFKHPSPFIFSAAVFFTFLSTSPFRTHAQTQTLQLERLIGSSEQEVESLKEMIKKGDVSQQTLERAARILESISLGIDKSIEPYQGTKLFTEALVKSQASDEFLRTYADVKTLNELNPKISEKDKTQNLKQSAEDELFKELIFFQKESVKANDEDLKNQAKLRAALNTAPPGFMDKIRAEIEISNWQTNTRLSAQATELLAVMHAIREELKLSRTKSDETLNPLSALILGSDQQNEIQKEKRGQRR